MKDNAGWRRGVILGLVAITGACASATGPDSGAEVEIRLAVSGGFAGVDWQFTIDGSRGEIVGDRCATTTGCDWEPGELLATFGAAELTALATEFFARGFFDGPADFGNQCCDQFSYTLTYVDSDDERTVQGSDGLLPQNVLDLILLVEQFVTTARG